MTLRTMVGHNGGPPLNGETNDALRAYVAGYLGAMADPQEVAELARMIGTAEPRLELRRVLDHHGMTPATGAELETADDVREWCGLLALAADLDPQNYGILAG